jgi:ribosomal protein L37AE/L43A
MDRTGQCPHCDSWLGLRRLEEIIFLYCRHCGYFEFDQADDPCSGYADLYRIRKLRLLLATETPFESRNNEAVKTRG